MLFNQNTMYFHNLTEAQILALAITAEEEDSQIYREFAEKFRVDFPKTAEIFTKMSIEESGHRRRLTELYQKKFGEHIPLIRRQDVNGFVRRNPIWYNKTLSPNKAREEAASMELEARRFYEAAAHKTTNTAIRQLLSDLAQEEVRHEHFSSKMTKEQEAAGELMEENHAERRLFILRIVQPGLGGLMDGSVSTLAPLFAAAFATNNTMETFKVGLAASIGAGISMGFTEALSDDGKLSGRGSPMLRGIVCGLMTVVGGVGHTLPYLISDFKIATAVAIGVVVTELVAISVIRWKYMDTPFLAATFQVIVGGVLVFLAGWLIGAG